MSPPKNPDLDYEDMYRLYDYEAAIKFLVAQAEEELKSGQDTRVVLIRFHNKASRLRRLDDSERRMLATKQRTAQDGQEESDETEET